MRMTITFDFFMGMFHHHDRGNQFSYENMRALFYYLEEAYNGDYDLDVIGLCCSYSEISLSELEDNYGIEVDFATTTQQEIREALEELGLTVINVDSGMRVLIED